MLSKQSIRKDKKISINGASISKDDLIELSKTWTENEESLFKKMLQQGGKFGIQSNRFQITLEDKMVNSKGDVDSKINPMDPKEGNIDTNYLK
tara:strand:- start:6080 stop:6358 length:279 start_codon:yes stop_codon:yes gene_type:complete